VKLRFEIWRGGDLIRVESFDSKSVESVVKIGKAAHAHLRIEDDPDISRTHAVIERDVGNNVFIIDIGSFRGTFVNGQKVNKATLNSGDCIQIGTTFITVTFDKSGRSDAPERERAERLVDDIMLVKGERALERRIAIALSYLKPIDDN